MQNYTGFAHIHIGGKARPFYYGVASAEIYCQREGIEFHEFKEALNIAFGKSEKQEDGSVKVITPMNPIYAGKFVTACLIAGYEYAEEPMDFQPSRVKFWLQEFTPETWNEVFNVVIGANKSPNASAPEQTMTVQ